MYSTPRWAFASLGQRTRGHDGCTRRWTRRLQTWLKNRPSGFHGCLQYTSFRCSTAVVEGGFGHHKPGRPMSQPDDLRCNLEASRRAFQRQQELMTIGMMICSALVT